MYAIAQADNVGGIDGLAPTEGPTSNLASVGTSSLVTNETQFLNYTNSIHGIQIKYPSNWNIPILPDAAGSGLNGSAGENKDSQLVAKFSSPTRDNVTISVDRFVEEPQNLC